MFSQMSLYGYYSNWFKSMKYISNINLLSEVELELLVYVISSTFGPDSLKKW